MLMEHASGYRSIRAPQGDGECVVDPPLETLPPTIAANRERLSRAHYDLHGRSLAELSAGARRGLLDHALRYTLQYRDVSQRVRAAIGKDNVSLILAGHQPQLFHPGVWYKNFILGSLSRDEHGIGVHLLIDSDLCRSASIRVPTGTAQNPRIEAVAYDEPAQEVPYEERTIRDSTTLRSFGDRVASVIHPLVKHPLIESLWPLVLNRNPGEANIGLRLAQGRHALEETWHLDTLELPQSVVCQLPEFSWFLAHVLAHLPRFWSAYNDALSDYRRTHRLRNRAHPVPDLTEADGWLEAPFWVWSANDPRRRPLFARQAGEEILVSDRDSRTFRLSLSADREALAAVEQLLELETRGVKLRTRALTTTLFARVVLSDLFLHGIGGAKYDQVTDQIARAFFGFQPPEFAVVSATLRLPITGGRVEAARDRSCAEQLRELRFHPERFLGPLTTSRGLAPIGQSAEQTAPVPLPDAVYEIISAKNRWVNTPQTPQNARQRHEAITAANEAMQSFVAERSGQIKSRCGELQLRKRADAILQSRDYSFCLYPRERFERLLDT
jgi:hypothetical protein